jgi:F-type H+-transporting ATPase subunit a
MKGLDLLKEHYWEPLSYFGLKHKFFNINAEIVLHTWIIIGIMATILGLIYVLVLKKKPGVTHYVITSFINYFVDLSKQSLGKLEFKHFVFVTSIFLFIFVGNTLAIIPGLEEPTKSINTTLALGLISFFYIQFYSIKSQGIKSYVGEYFSPFFIMFPLNVIGKVASIISLSFRLFGNIFGGVIITKIFISAIEGNIFTEIPGLIFGIPITFFFSLFEGFLQGFVFMMLTLTYLSIAVQGKTDQLVEEAS